LAARVFSVHQFKGGCGKTTLTTNLAAAIFKTFNKRVAIIDADPQTNAPLTFGLRTKADEGLMEVMIKDLPIEAIRHEIAQEGNGCLHVFNGGEKLSGFEGEVSNKPEYEPSEKYLLFLKKVITPIKEQYDYIFIDTAPSIGLLNQSIFLASNKILIPMAPESYSTDGMLSILRLFDELKEYNDEVELGGVVFTKVQRNIRDHQNIMREMEEYLDYKGVKRYQTELPQTTIFQRSVNEDGTCLFLNQKLNKKDPKFVLLFRSLAGEVIHE